MHISIGAMESPSFSDELVPRPIWEPRHEWQSRVKFVEDNLADYGVEKALNLSLVWANMNFLGCRYPSGTEHLVQSYPVPSFDELKQRRRKSKGIPKPETSFAEVTALLSSAHTQSILKATHLEIQTIANELCLCKECLKQEPGKTESFSRKGMKILECYKQQDATFVYDVSQKDNQTEEVWTLTLNGAVALERNGSMGQLMEEFVKILHNWQEANQKPPCPLLAKQLEEGSPADTSNTDQHNQSYGAAYDSRHSGYGSSGYETPDGRRMGGAYQGSPGYSDKSGYRGSPIRQGSPNLQGNYHGSPNYRGSPSYRGSPNDQGPGRYQGSPSSFRGRGGGYQGSGPYQSSNGGYQGRGSGGYKSGRDDRGGYSGQGHGPERKRGRNSPY